MVWVCVSMCVRYLYVCWYVYQLCAYKYVLGIYVLSMCMCVRYVYVLECVRYRCMPVCVLGICMYVLDMSMR